MAIETRNQWYELTGKSPTGLDGQRFKLSHGRVADIHKYAPASVYENMLNVEPTLIEPVRIFKGLNRDGHENSFCYVSEPELKWIRAGVSLPAPSDHVFSVYVMDTFEIYDWDFVPKDASNQCSPKEYIERFGVVSWEK